MHSKLVTIALVAPIFVILASSLVIGFEIIAISPVIYTVMFSTSLPFLFGVNALFQRYQFGSIMRFLIVLVSGFFGSAAVYFVLFFGSINQGLLSLSTFSDYCYIGVFLALVTFILYSFGPTRVEKTEA